MIMMFLDIRWSNFKFQILTIFCSLMCMESKYKIKLKIMFMITSISFWVEHLKEFEPKVLMGTLV
jgi:hypothetical protein